jgi:hypothetical protein
MSTETATGEAPEAVASWTLDALAQGDRRAKESAQSEVAELARALAAQAVALSRDASTDEFEDRYRTLERGLWPDDPLSGFALGSSLGAYLVARVAMSWAPPTESAIRADPLNKEQLLAELNDHNIEPALAATLVGDWGGVVEGFAPDYVGLGAAAIAGLAEGTLSVRERDLALSQIAYSPRCLARLASTIVALNRMRAVLPVLTPEGLDLGAGYAPAAAALALGRPERTLELLGYAPDRTALLTLVELAKCERSFRRGEPAVLADDPSVAVPPIESEMRRTAPPPVPHDSSDDEDDVLEIVEERVAEPSEPPDSTSDRPEVRRPPRTPTWVSSLGMDQMFDEAFLLQWQSARRSASSLLAKRQRLLGVTPAPKPRSLPDVAVPPEPRALASLIESGGLAADEQASELMSTTRIEVATQRVLPRVQQSISSPGPIFSAARSALRAIASAAEGRPPSVDAIEASGDLDWVLRRARAIALGAKGDLERASFALVGLEPKICPEARWLQMRRARFAARPPEPARPEEARRLAAGLVADLAQALLRSVAGTLA